MLAGWQAKAEAKAKKEEETKAEKVEEVPYTYTTETGEHYQVPQPSTLNPQPSTLNPQPSHILNPNPPGVPRS